MKILWHESRYRPYYRHKLLNVKLCGSDSLVCCFASSELVYEDVFAVWESIWAAKHVSSSQFVLFIALALVEIYRDIILENNMDFTDIIKFFNGNTANHDYEIQWNFLNPMVHF